MPCADHFIAISVAVIYEAWSLMRFMFFGDIHFVTNYHFAVILLFVFLEILHSVVFYRFIITEWSDQPDLCNVNGDVAIFLLFLFRCCVFFPPPRGLDRKKYMFFCRLLCLPFFGIQNPLFLRIFFAFRFFCFFCSVFVFALGPPGRP